jgi:NhaA family Na+:H+ antiporter
MSERSGLRSYAVRRVVRPLQAFIQTEIAGGVILLVAATFALAWANSPWDDAYFDLLHESFTLDFFGIFKIEEDFQHIINDGLMTLFFFVVGMEIKRELTKGELRGRDRATLPVVAALGGMIAPALIYVALNSGTEGEQGWGIPMATDIAFALGLLALVGSRIPTTLRVFLLALAIVDDIGAILVIAVFYTDNLNPEYLLLAAVLLGLVYAMKRAGVASIPAYFLVGGAVWLAVFESGVHATIAGVVLGLMTPTEPYYSPSAYQQTVSDLLARFHLSRAEGDEEAAEEILAQLDAVTDGTESPLEKLERGLHPYSSYLIVPLFAFANAGVSFAGGIVGDSLSSSITLGIALGLLVGKPLGILVFCWCAVRMGMAQLPGGTSWPHLVGVGMLAGIGFTVALFINDLAFDTSELTDEGKIGIFAGSIGSALLGLATLVFVTRGASRDPVPTGQP